MPDVGGFVWITISPQSGHERYIVIGTAGVGSQNFAPTELPINMSVCVLVKQVCAEFLVDVVSG